MAGLLKRSAAAADMVVTWQQRISSSMPLSTSMVCATQIALIATLWVFPLAGCWLSSELREAMRLAWETSWHATSYDIGYNFGSEDVIWMRWTTAGGAHRQEKASRPNRAVPSSGKTQFTHTNRNHYQIKTYGNETDLLGTDLVSSGATQRKLHQRNHAIPRTPKNARRTGERFRKKLGTSM